MTKIAPTEVGAVAGNGLFGGAAVELLLESGIVMVAAASFPMRLADRFATGNDVGANTAAYFWTTDASSSWSGGGSA